MAFVTGRSASFGVVLMLGVAIIGAVDAIIVKMVSPSVHPFIIAFTRSLFGLLLVLPWILTRPALLKSHYRFRHFVRAFLKLASLIAFFGAYATAPLADVTAIAFTAPLFVTLGALMFLSEKPQFLRMLAVLVGFVGVIVIVRPAQHGVISIGLSLALLGAFLTAVIQLILKPMSAKDSTETLVAWNLILTVPIAAIPAFFVWKMPTGEEWILLAIQGVMGVMAMGMVTRAFSMADASLLAPIDFLRLPIVAILAYLLFSQVAGATTLIGGTMIFIASLLMARSARVRKTNQC